MKAAVVYQHGSLDQIVLEENYPVPVPGADWVQVRIEACSLNHHDIFTRRGMPGIKTPLPIVIGSDVSGVITEVGKNVESWKRDERVLIDPLPTKENGYRFFGENVDGGRAEFCVAHKSQIVRIPDGVSFEAAACMPLAYATAHRMLFTIGKLKRDEKVLVYGASGGIGTASLLLAKMAGATVIACTGNDEKARKLREIGADHVVNYKTQDVKEAVWDVVGKPKVLDSSFGCDIVINSSGGSWVDSVRCLKTKGRLLTCGATAGYDVQVDVRYVWTFEQQLFGSNGWTREDISHLLGMLQSGELNPPIDRVVPLDEVKNAEASMENREVFGKVVIRP